MGAGQGKHSARTCAVLKTHRNVVYVKQLLFRLERVQMSSESIIKNVTLSSFDKEGKTFFLCISYSERSSVEDLYERNRDRHFHVQP